MTKEQRKIMRLTQKLHDLTELVEEIKFNAVDGEWDAHHCVTLVVGDSINEYQVLRHIDIEIEYVYDVEQRVYDSLTPEQQQKVTDGELDIWENFEDDLFEHQYDFEYGEFLQQWINLKTGHITNIGKRSLDAPKYCDWKRDWEIITPDMEFTNTFLDGHYSGFYCDIKINPILSNAGYCAFDTTSTDWQRKWGDDNCQSKFIQNTNMAEFILQVASGTTPLCRLIKMYDFNEILYMLRLDQPYQEEYKAAMRIRRKNNYTLHDLGLWQDHMKILYELGKDLHNAHYVCPKDLVKEHTYYNNILQRKQAKEKLLAQIQEAAKYEESYHNSKNKYLGLLFTDNAGFVIAPLQSVKDFADEGMAMHHCVYTNGYYKGDDCLIFSAKDMNGNRLATIQFSLADLRIVQCRGINNSVPQFDEQIQKCINSHIKDIKRIRDKNYRKTA